MLTVFADDRLYSIEGVMAHTGYSRGYIYKLMKRGFPRPLLAGTGSRSARWLGAELNSWLEARIDEREAREQEAANVTS